MNQQPKKKRKGWRLGRDSYHKLIVYFHNGNSRTRYSIDWRHAYSKTRDPAIGFANFRKLISKWGKAAKTVLIYHIATDTKVAHYFEGEEVEIDDDV